MNQAQSQKFFAGVCDFDGYSLIRFIRNKETLYGGFLPAIALTSYLYPEGFNTAIDAGFQSVICKPFDPDELIATVANLAQLTRLESDKIS
ncbi:hypothetical protein JYQ62_27715 [Nostoc sp. UHCC 0702]|nr:hypothetical protein JYQ62_27715 [Nostoc sp. UHCC 0702]